MAEYDSVNSAKLKKKKRKKVINMACSCYTLTGQCAFISVPVTEGYAFNADI